jgi:hypothetical protein
MIIVWKGYTQYNSKGALKPGTMYAVPDDVGERWIAQGVAEQYVEPVVSAPAPIIKKKKEAKHG